MPPTTDGKSPKPAALLMTGLLGLAGLTLAACEREGPAEKAGEKIDDAVDDAQDAVEDAADDLEDAVDDATDGAP